jgi:hypothetical protein
MTDINIHNFSYFLEQLEKNLAKMEDAVEREHHALANMRILQDVISKMCKNWINQLEHRQ